MKRIIEIVPKADITPLERQRVNDILRQLAEIDGKGIMVFKDAALPVPLPMELIEGPAKVYNAMVVGASYSVDHLATYCGLAKSTCYRLISTLVERGIVNRVKESKGRGRPTYLYELNKHKEVTT